MNFDKAEIEAGAAMARRVLNKPEHGDAVKSPAERRAAWLREQAGERQAERPDAERVSAEVLQTRSQLQRPGTEFTVGSERYAADGSRWRRTA